MSLLEDEQRQPVQNFAVSSVGPSGATDFLSRLSSLGDQITASESRLNTLNQQSLANPSLNMGDVIGSLGMAILPALITKLTGGDSASFKDALSLGGKAGSQFALSLGQRQEKENAQKATIAGQEAKRLSELTKARESLFTKAADQEFTSEQNQLNRDNRLTAAQLGKSSININNQQIPQKVFEDVRNSSMVADQLQKLMVQIKNLPEEDVTDFLTNKISSLNPNTEAGKIRIRLSSLARQYARSREPGVLTDNDVAAWEGIVTGGFFASKDTVLENLSNILDSVTKDRDVQINLLGSSGQFNNSSLENMRAVANESAAGKSSLFSGQRPSAPPGHQYFRDDKTGQVKLHKLNATGTGWEVAE